MGYPSSSPMVAACSNLAPCKNLCSASTAILRSSGVLAIRSVWSSPLPCVLHAVGKWKNRFFSSSACAFEGTSLFIILRNPADKLNASMSNVRSFLWRVFNVDGG